MPNLPYILINDLPIALHKLPESINRDNLDDDFILSIGTEIQDSLFDYFEDVRLIDSNEILSFACEFGKATTFPLLSMSSLLQGETLKCSTEEIPYARYCELFKQGNNHRFEYA